MKLTNKKVEKAKKEVDYPQLQPKHAQELIQPTFRTCYCGFK